MISHRTLTQPRKPWYFALIDRTGIRYDASAIFASPAAFRSLLDDMTTHFADTKHGKIVGLDAQGLIVGAALAARTQTPFVPLRKGGKLPFDASQLEGIAFADWDGVEKRFELRRGWVAPGDRVLLVDEWMATGAQMQAAIALLERVGAVVAGVATIYLHPDFEANLDVARKYETFAANCLVCKYFVCICQVGTDAETREEMRMME